MSLVTLVPTIQNYLVEPMQRDVVETAEGCWHARDNAQQVEFARRCREDPAWFFEQARASAEALRGPMWSVSRHAELAGEEQRKQVPWLLWLGRELGTMRCAGAETAFTDAWLHIVMPELLGRPTQSMWFVQYPEEYFGHWSRDPPW